MSIGDLCRLFGYSKQAYYKRKLQPVPKVQKEEVLKKVLSIRKQLPRSGVRKLQYMLNESKENQSQKIGRDFLFDLMRERSLLVSKRKKYHKTTNSRHWMRKYPNSIKDLEINRPEQVWVADITYLQVQKVHYYLHLITDAYSKRIVGYQLSGNMLATTTLKALQKAIGGRQYKKGLIHHSDRGLQYSSSTYTQTLKDHDIAISMTEASDPYENAIAERVNGILKDEFGLDDVFESYGILNKQVIQSITLYNQLRPHLSINMLTPNQAHRQNKVKLRQWKTTQPSKSTSKAVNNQCNFNQ